MRLASNTTYGSALLLDNEGGLDTIGSLISRCSSHSKYTSVALTATTPCKPALHGDNANKACGPAQKNGSGKRIRHTEQQTVLFVLAAAWEWCACLASKGFSVRDRNEVDCHAHHPYLPKCVKAECFAGAVLRLFLRSFRLQVDLVCFRSAGNARHDTCAGMAAHT